MNKIETVTSVGFSFLTLKNARHKKLKRRKLVVPRLWNWNTWKRFYARL